MSSTIRKNTTQPPLGVRLTVDFEQFEAVVGRRRERGCVGKTPAPASVVIVRNPAEDRARRRTIGRAAPNLKPGSPRDLALPDVETLQLLVDQVVQVGGPESWGDVVMIPATTALRISEVSGLAVGDVDLGRDLLAAARITRGDCSALEEPDSSSPVIVSISLGGAAQLDGAGAVPNLGQRVGPGAEVLRLQPVEHLLAHLRRQRPEVEDSMLVILIGCGPAGSAPASRGPPWLHHPGVRRAASVDPPRGTPGSGGWPTTAPKRGEAFSAGVHSRAETQISKRWHAAQQVMWYQRQVS